MSKDEVGVPAAGRLLFSSIGRNLDEKKSGGVFKLKQKNEEKGQKSGFIFVQTILFGSIAPCTLLTSVKPALTAT